ncbi:hypothetical protein JX265_010283 [Neoarthrinium moseri]|uniref:Ribosomal RNA-processing protein 1 n=1 Tax=Neoarthrinium moseri TaxID=1658444 RepID=A0A9Q0AKL1_9PEZI|nr:hypothetical protein JX265_010283 [Neoarthrinium moseri]
MAADEKSMPFLKNLASSDRKIRTSALGTLRTFLSASTTSRALTPLDNLKLWKGLFYSLYMCDRPVPQQNLCADLAALLDVLPDDAVAPWLVGFWDVMGREWTTGIDVLRMEKFLLLVRRVLGRSLVWAHEVPKAKGAKGKKAADARRVALLELFREWPFESTGDLKKMPVGLRLHVLDIWVDEAEKAGMIGEDSTEADAEFLNGIREILQAMIGKTVTPVKPRAKESLADERLPWYEKKEGTEAEDEEMTEDGDSDRDSFGGFDD